MIMPNEKWILVAEDNAHDAELTARALAANHPRNAVTLASDGAAALDCLYHRGAFQSRNHDPPAFVLLDLKMPKVDGLDVLRTIKNDPGLKCIPVVVFSSSSEPVDLERCYQLGANAYVVKPLNFQEFAASLVKLDEFWMNVNEPPPGNGVQNGFVDEKSSAVAQAGA